MTSRRYLNSNRVAAITAVVILLAQWHTVRGEITGVGSAPRLGDERIVFQTTLGDLELALYPDVSQPYK